MINLLTPQQRAEYLHKTYLHIMTATIAGARSIFWDIAKTAALASVSELIEYGMITHKSKEEQYWYEVFEEIKKLKDKAYVGNIEKI